MSDAQQKTTWAIDDQGQPQIVPLDRWNEASIAFNSLIETVIEIRGMLAECDGIGEDIDSEYVHQQVQQTVETLKLAIGNAESIWLAINPALPKAIADCGLGRPSGHLSWTGYILDTVRPLHNKLSRELNYDDVRLCLRRLPHYLSLIPAGIEHWQDHVSAELRAGSLFNVEPVETVSNGQSAEPVDGPVLPNGFRFNEVEYFGLQNIPWRLMNYVWNSENRCCSLDGMATEVWGDAEIEFSGDPLKAAAKKVREFFTENHLPFGISSSERKRNVRIFSAKS